MSLWFGLNLKLFLIIVQFETPLESLEYIG